jgi:hypothetical protein
MKLHTKKVILPGAVAAVSAGCGGGSGGSDGPDKPDWMKREQAQHPGMSAREICAVEQHLWNDQGDEKAGRRTADCVKMGVLETDELPPRSYDELN